MCTYVYLEYMPPWFMAVDGVKSARMRIVNEITIVEDWLRDQIAMRS